MAQARGVKVNLVKVGVTPVTACMGVKGETDMFWESQITHYSSSMWTKHGHMGRIFPVLMSHDVTALKACSKHYTRGIISAQSRSIVPLAPHKIQPP